LGSAGIIVSLIWTGILFRRTERLRVDSRDSVQAMVGPDQKLTLRYEAQTADALLAGSGEAGKAIAGRPTSLSIIYSYGDFRAATKVARSDDMAAKPIEITRESTVPANKVVAFFSNPFGNLDAARTAPLRIDNALITPVPGARNGWLVALTLYLFVAFYAVGPGVCVWLALSELMPTRIRSNGMSIALLINQGFSTGIAAVFLPTVGKFGYGTMFFTFAACTVVYFLTAALFLPETKGKTLEEIEAHFEGAKA
jgi:MFS transporter, SP family, solute carrier family 2 (myo-inositol transporter), member 13